jgi:penicillin-binding protein
MTPSTEFPSRNEKIEEDKWRPSDTGEFGPWRGAVITRVYINNRKSPLNMKNAMLDSDNIYFAYSALRTGISDYLDYIEPIGFTEAVPFDLPVQKAQLKNEKAEWSPMLLAATSFGQGEVLMTPLQAAAMFSVFANNGSIMRPYVVEGLYRENGTEYERLEGGEPTVWKENVISQEIINTLLPMLVEVNENGTGAWLDLKREIKIAGKTGTTQVDGNGNRELAWYAGFRAEGDNPRLVLVMLELPANVEAFSQTKFDIARPLLRETVQETE